jgi:membrane fusion protein
MVTLLLVFMLWVVEVPSRINATGMLMPSGGILDVVAPDAGQISAVYVKEQQFVRQGDPLIEVVAHGTDSGGSLSSGVELQSLHNEYDLLGVIYERRHAVFLEQRERLNGELEVAQQKLELAEKSVADNLVKVGIVESRYSRLQQLARTGHVARDVIDNERLTLLDVRAAATAAELDISVTRAELERLNSRDTETRREIELFTAEHSLRKQQLMREIKRREYLASHKVFAPRGGKITRLFAETGMSIRKNQPVGKILGDKGLPEAWIYVSSTNARQIRIGESVELQLDAWPASKFGTLTATVESVSGFVLGTAELPVPIAINGPVFEVRASLTDSEWGRVLPGPGTTFSAQIISRRYRLYQWLTKHFRGRADPNRA